MNLRRHLNVMRRFRLILALGLVLGVALGTLAVFRVSGSGLEWRSGQTFESHSTINVTQSGFPEGRVVLGNPQATTPAGTTDSSTTSDKQTESFADPGRFANLAITYAYYAQSDAVRKLINPRPLPTQVTVSPVPAAANSAETLPILSVSTTSDSEAKAITLNGAVIKALRGYIEGEQRRNGIDAKNRVRLDVLSPPSKASVLIGHSKTPAVVAFLLVMAATFALAYALDNLYPAGRRHEGPDGVDAVTEPTRVAGPAPIPAPPGVRDAAVPAMHSVWSAAPSEPRRRAS